MGMSAQAGVTAALRRLRVIPVVVIDDPHKAPALANALIEGGLPCAEITFRTKGALESLRRIAETDSGFMVGAGTVLTPAQAADAQAAGARFVVAPGFTRSVVDYCLEHDIPVYPGVCTPTEIQAAIEAGLSEMKFFPVEPLGGVAYLKAASAPFRDLKFIPTGGITTSSLGSYLALPNVIACGGSWIATADMIEGGRFDDIRDAATAAIASGRMQ